MLSGDDKKQREDLENEVWSAIAAFEQIVQTIPDDRVSLEALSHAYEQIGDLARARDYFLRLVDVVLNERDREAAELLRERLALFAASGPAAKEVETRLDHWLASDKPGGKTYVVAGEKGAPAPMAADDAEHRSAHVTAELSFAWTLFQSGELTQEEYAQVAQDLSEISASKTPVTVSVLHVLHDRGNRNVERIVSFASKDSAVPVIPLSLFDIQEAVLSMLPREFTVRHGVMVFELMGKEALVVLLNPYDRTLQATVEAMIGRKCHFFLTLPSEFDAVAERLGHSDNVKKEATA